MSITNVQGTNINFDVQIASAIRKGAENVTDVARSKIDTGAISFLEIEDNLIDPGIKGYISLRNSFGILDRVRLLRDSERSFFIDINLEDVQTRTNKLEDKKISFLGLIENNSSLSNNVTDDNILIQFEEAQTSLMKKTSLHKLVELQQIDTQKDQEMPNLLNTILTSWLSMISTPSDKEAGQLYIDEAWSQVKGNDVTGNIRSFWPEIEDSVYDVFYRIYQACLLGSAGKLPSLKIKSSANTSGAIDRKFTLSDMFTDRHRAFISNYPQGGNFADVYTEEFTIVPETNTNARNASLYNEVEKYSLARTDIKAAREKFWCNYIVSAHGDGSSPADITITDTNIIKFSKIVDKFEQDDLATDRSVFSNTPVLTTNDLKLIKVDQGVAAGGRAVAENQVYNQVKNSLLFLNDSIVFTVKGQLYRKPGTFITINGGEVISDSNEKLHDVWFVVSVKHRFKEMYYENEIVAVRLFGNKERYTSLTGEPIEE